LPFKSALLSALDPLPPGVTVVPVWLDYGPASAGIAWVGEEHGLDNFRRLLAQSEKIDVTIHFLEPLESGQLANRKVMAQAARQTILDVMEKLS